MIETGGSHGFMWLCGNFHSKPEMPFYKGLNFPFLTVLSVNQLQNSSLGLSQKDIKGNKGVALGVKFLLEPEEFLAQMASS